MHFYEIHFQGIEQMNTLESMFEASPPSTAAPAAQNDPWASTAPSDAAGTPATGSSSDDLKDIDLFGADAVQPKKKEDIMSLFGPPAGQPGMGPGFGAPQQAMFAAPPQQAMFGAPPPAQPGFGATFPQQPGFQAPAANPFGGPQPVSKSVLFSLLHTYYMYKHRNFCMSVFFMNLS